MRRGCRVGTEVSGEARARMKYQGLLQDYEELLKETETKKKILDMAKQRKLRLMAEVKFLRNKYKGLSRNPSKASSYRLKKQPQTEPLQNLVINAKLPANDKNQSIREAGARGTFALLDLNKAFLPNGEEIEEFQAEQEATKTEKKRSLMEEAVGSELKLSICRDLGTSANRTGKRKILWQDQVALRV